MKRITIRRPDDWHLHLRDGELLAAVLPHSAARFARAIIMPNLRPPVTTTAQALAYRDRIRAALPAGADFAPLMTLYLTDATPPEEIVRARESGAVFGVKFYPSGATTNSDEGVTDIHKARPALAAMAECGLPLLVHGEVTDPAVDIFDREAVFIERILAPLLDDLPDLRVILEHVTTRQGVGFVMAAGDRVAATVTPQHMAMNRNELFRGGLRPHHYCLPVLKREEHREAVCAAATSGHPRLFLGSDSAPHPRGAKESACGCAGIYSAHAAIELYAEIFDRAGALDRLEPFASLNGPAFYGLPPNEERIVLERTPWRVPESYAAGDETIVPLRAGEEIAWRIVAQQRPEGTTAI